MLVFEWTVALLLAAVVLAGIARRIGVPYPAFLALGGAGLAFVPGAPRFTLDPELALALFVAPVLLDAAFDLSPRDLKRSWLPVAGLAIGAVAVTTAAVAILAHALVADLPWAAAIALGAIVAPPDAAAASALLRQLRPPHRIMTILEGESLLNDASALLIFRWARSLRPSCSEWLEASSRARAWPGFICASRGASRTRRRRSSSSSWAPSGSGWWPSGSASRGC